MIVSACLSLRSSRATCRRNSAFSRSTAVLSVAFGPRRFVANPESTPASRCLRQASMCDEYSPSRLSRAPRSPRPRASYCSTMRPLYSPSNRRRWAFSVTSELALLPLPEIVGSIS